MRNWYQNGQESWGELTFWSDDQRSIDGAQGPVQGLGDRGAGLDPLLSTVCVSVIAPEVSIRAFLFPVCRAGDRTVRTAPWWLVGMQTGFAVSSPARGRLGPGAVSRIGTAPAGGLSVAGPMARFDLCVHRGA